MLTAVFLPYLVGVSISMMKNQYKWKFIIIVGLNICMLINCVDIFFFPFGNTKVWPALRKAIFSNCCPKKHQPRIDRGIVDKDKIFHDL